MPRDGAIPREGVIPREGAIPREDAIPREGVIPESWHRLVSAHWPASVFNPVLSVLCSKQCDYTIAHHLL